MTTRATLVVARFEGRNRLPVTIVIAALFVVYAAMFLWLGPTLVADPALQDLIDAFPPIMNELFGFESLTSLEGLFASEFYTFGWTVGFGGYLAYTAASSVAGDIESDRMGQLLAGPVPRVSVVVGKYLALLVPILVLNVVVPAVIYGGSVLVGEPFSVQNLVLLHVLSVPYLLFWSAVGLLLGTVVGRPRIAGRVGVGLVFLSWVLDSVLVTTDYAWIARGLPTHYFDPPAILVDGTVDSLGSTGLLLTAVVILGVAVAVFVNRDL